MIVFLVEKGWKGFEVGEGLDKFGVSLKMRLEGYFVD